jgi:glutaredoxin
MKVFMYTLSTCPWCRKAKQFFKENNIPFDYVDYDLQPEDEQEKIMEKMLKISGARSFPVVTIEEQVIIGYNPDKYSDLLGLKKGETA